MPTGRLDTTRGVRTEGRLPQVSRTLVVGVVALAVLLSAMGMVLAMQQSQLLITGRVAELRQEASRRVSTVNREAISEIEQVFVDVNVHDHGASTRPASQPATAEADSEIEQASVDVNDRENKASTRPASQPATGKTKPSWLLAFFIWDDDRLHPSDIRSSRPLPPEDISELAKDLRSRLAYSLLDGGGGPLAFRSYRHTLSNGKKVAVIYGPLRSKDGKWRVAVAIADRDILQRDLVDRVVGTEGDMTVVDTEVRAPEIDDVTPTWSESLGPLFPFWSVQPSAHFLLEQERSGQQQALLYAGVTLLGLVALLLAIRTMNQVAQHEISLSRMQANFVADVSHELKTPLALIRMFGETLLSGRVPSESKAREYYDIIIRESTRLTHLIDNILDFSRIDAGRKHYRYEVVDVGRVVRETYDAYRHELDHHGFEHCCTIAEGLPSIYGDDDAIGQVVLNLISNAIKYSSEERYLHVDVQPETRRDRHGVLICVRDRGIGIRPEDRAHLFDGFYRAPDERVRQSRGTGLGLALCKKIVDAHGGHIDVESRLVKGSEFRVFFPQDHEASEEKE